MISRDDLIPSSRLISGQDSESGMVAASSQEEVAQAVIVVSPVADVAARASAELAMSALRAELHSAKGRLQAIEASTLYRAMQPLRRAGQMLPGGLRRALRRAARLGWWTVTLQLPRRLRDYSAARAGGVPHSGGAGQVPSRSPGKTRPPERGVAPRPAADWRESFVQPVVHEYGGLPRLPAPAMPRVLIIDCDWPKPDRDSGSVDAVLQARALRTFGYEVIFASDNFTTDASPERDRLEADGILCLTPRQTPSIEAFLRSDGVTLALCILSRVHSGGRYLEAVRRHAPQAKVVFNTVDLHHLREEREAQLAGNVTEVRRAGRIREREYYLTRQADATIVVSAAERAVLMRDVPGAAVFEMPLARPTRPLGAVPGFDGRRGVGFVGGFGHAPNVDALRYLLDDIWPRVLLRLPDARLSIVGADLRPETLAGAPAGVEYLGQLPDLDPWLDGLRLTVAPLRYGAGAKGKVASSIAAGVPCVGTPVAAEGMRLQDGVHIVVCDTAEKFAARICELHEMPVYWARLSAGSHERARGEFSVEAGEQRLAALLRALLLPVLQAGADTDPS